MKYALIAAGVFAFSMVAGYGIRVSTRDSPVVPAARPTEPAYREHRADPALQPPGTPTLELALARDARPEYAPARAPLWGRVRTVDGAPVPGARIEAWPIPWTDGASPLESRVRAWAEEERAASDRRIEATTDTSGYFELGSLRRADYRVRASHESWTIWRTDGADEPVRPGSYITFVARAAAPADVEIRVLSASGRELEEAFIRMQPARGEDWPIIRSLPRLTRQGFHWTPSDRRLRVPVECELTARSADGSSSSEGVVVSPAAPPAEVVLRFAERRGIVLEPVYPEGCEKAVVRAAAMLIDAGRPPSVPRFARAAKWMDYHGGLRSASSPLVEDIPAGTYMVGVTLGKKAESDSFVWSGSRGPPTRGGVVDAWTTVDVTAGFATARVEVSEPSPDGAILARVRGPDGELLDRVEFRLFYTDPERPNRDHGGVDWRRRADGSYLLYPRGDRPVAVLSGRTPGTLHVIASHETHGEAEGTVALAVAPSVDIAIVTPGRLSLSFTGGEGPDVAGRLRVQLTPHSRSMSRVDPSSIEDPIVYEGITPGEYEATVTFSCGRGGALELAKETVSIASGGVTDLAVEIPRLHKVTLHVGETTQRLRHGLYVIEGEGLSVRVTASRRDEEILLPAGDFAVSSRRHARSEVPPLLRFTVPDVTEIDLAEIVLREEEER